MPDNPYYKSAHWRALRNACIARDRGRCTAAASCAVPGRVCDHIETRPDVPYPTELDVLGNVRLLCKSHDAQVKEQRRGVGMRRQAGAFKQRGCDADGWPHDPARR